MEEEEEEEEDENDKDAWVTEKKLLNRAVSAVNTVSQGVVLFA